jgi:hypothetical protein
MSKTGEGLAMGRPNQHDDDSAAEPRTYFEYERARRSITNPGEEPTGNPLSYPKLPAGSPWSEDPVPPEEPINRTEDGVAVGIPIDQT